MTKAKSILSIILALTLSLSLCSCGATTADTGENIPVQATKVDSTEGLPSVTSQPVSPKPEEPAPPELTEPDLPIPEEPAPPEPTIATLLVCGDAMSHMPLTNDVHDAATDTYDYSRIFASAAPLAEAADYAVVNLETVLAGPPYSGYPTFNSPDALAYDLAEAGFDLCLTANNHCMDQRYDGLCRTLDVLDEVGLAHVGTSRSQEEADANVVLADVGGISVAFLGYTYGTNGIPLPKSAPYAVNLFNKDYMTDLSDPDYERLEAGLEAAKALSPDLIAVMIHWGVEYKTKQNAYQEEVADFLFSHGADLVLGGHPHVLQPMETRTLEDGRQGFVCYSLGNFFSSQDKELTDTTVALTLELTRDNETGTTQVTGWSYTPFYMLDREEGTSPRFELLDVHSALESGVSDEALEGKLNKAIEDCHEILGSEHDAGVGGANEALTHDCSKRAGAKSPCSV